MVEKMSKRRGLMTAYPYTHLVRRQLKHDFSTTAAYKLDGYGDF